MLEFPVTMQMFHEFSLVTNNSEVLLVNLRQYQKKIWLYGMIFLLKITFHDIFFVTDRVSRASELVIDPFSFSITLVTVILNFYFRISIQPYSVNF